MAKIIMIRERDIIGKTISESVLKRPAIKQESYASVFR